MNTDYLKQQINELIAGQNYDNIKPLLLSYKDITEHDNDLAITCYLCTIYEQERDAGQPTIFSKVSGLEELLERYTILKFYLRRIDFRVIDDGMEAFYLFLSQNQVSSYELLRIVDFCVVHKEMVLRVIKGEAAENNDSSPGTVCETLEEGSGNTWLGKETGTMPDTDSVQEVCFVICTHRQMYARECIYYINHLIVPDGVRVDILTVEDAKSLASAYNEAIQYSKAKYKVYLHHDTFIVNPNFIRDCLEIFRKNPQIGMIGNIGTQTMPDSGIMWDADRYGMLYEQHIYETELLANAFSPEREYLEVEAIDGFLMVTQYDLPWREDLFTKWDFYDVSQSMEFIRKGYQVVVPNMKEPWCVHDCGFINLKDYDEEREKYVKEYLTKTL